MGLYIQMKFKIISRCSGAEMTFAEEVGTAINPLHNMITLLLDIWDRNAATLSRQSEWPWAPHVLWGHHVLHTQRKIIKTYIDSFHHCSSAVLSVPAQLPPHKLILVVCSTICAVLY